MTFSTEFPDFDGVLPSIPGFIDASWHNDTCPSLVRPSFDDDAQTLTIWCDYVDTTKREFEGGKLFTLVRDSDNFNNNHAILLETDDVAELAAFIAAL